MKNYTTIEQSNRLIQLGVPVNSADCIYIGESTIPVWIDEDKTYTDIINQGDIESKNITPCWSSGQLLYILSKSYLLHSNYSYVYDTCNEYTCDEWIEEIKYRLDDGELDFSKLCTRL